MSRSLFSLCRGAMILMLALAAGGLRAQDFDQIGPKQPPAPAPGKIVNDTGAKPLAGHGEGEVLVPQLKGIVMLNDAKQVKRDGIGSGPAIQPGNVAYAKNPDFPAAVQPYLGQPVTMKSLAELTRSIVAYYRAHDRPVVNVYVPEQRITSGYIQVVVVESRVGKVEATGAHWFSNQQLKNEIRLRPEEPISSIQMRADLGWINRNPFRQSDILLAPGDQPGTTDVLLRTQDRFPLRPYIGYEDSGNQYTGNDRYLTGFNYGNLFGIGEQISYQFTAGDSINTFYAHSGTWTIPLPWRHILTFFGSYSATDANLGSGFDSAGVNWQVSTRYEIPLPGTAAFTQSLTAGFDFKRSNNGLAFGVATFSNTNTDVDQFVFNYAANYADDYGSTAANATLFFSPGNQLTPYNNDNDYGSQRTGARSNYVYGQVAATRVTRLPLDFTWTIRAELQESDANLLPSEQFGIGGYQTVRGYEERQANGDNGFLLSTEVLTPPISLFQLAGCHAVHDQLQFLGFVDYGGTSLHQGEPSDVNPNSNLLGVGPGIRYAINPYLSFRFDYGFQLTDAGQINGQHSRAHIGVLISY